ncbi:MAG: PPA1309 family protein [Jatrophihabitantaceae bacterium]
MTPAVPFLESAAAEIEAHVRQAGWDQRPALFALVRAAKFAADEPEAAERLGLGDAVGDALTPIEQGELPDGPLDEALAQISWPDSVLGCALSQEIMFLPPSAEASLPDGPQALNVAANHPERREARLVVAVVRDGTSAVVLRLRPTEPGSDELLTGPDLAPNLAQALLATLLD